MDRLDPDPLQLARELRLVELVRSVGVGGLLELLLQHCDQEAARAQAAGCPTAAAWDAWARALAQIPGLSPTAPTQPYGR